jgi:hypothetical protein
MNSVYCDICKSRRKNRHKKACILNTTNNSIITSTNNSNLINVSSTLCEICGKNISTLEYPVHKFNHELQLQESGSEVIQNNNLMNNLLIYPGVFSYSQQNEIIGRKRRNSINLNSLNPPYENSRIRVENSMFQDSFIDIINMLVFLNRAVSYENQTESVSMEIFKNLPKIKIKCDEDPLIKDNDKCTICMEEYTVGNKVVTLPCLHLFHEKCIKKWFGEKSTCPVCKFKIDESIYG